jgi:Tol biopolymer transport system component
VTRDPVDDNDPVFSPVDDNLIAYRFGRPANGAVADIHTISVDGSNERGFALPDYQQDPSWSPGGDQIACKTGPSTYATIGIITVSTGRMQLLRGDAGPDTTPAWSAR